jgi:hypothetical protein
MIPVQALCPYFDGFMWADPNQAHLGQPLQHVFENREESARIVRRPVVELREKWTRAHAARRIIEWLDKIGR